MNGKNQFTPERRFWHAHSPTVIIKINSAHILRLVYSEELVNTASTTSQFKNPTIQSALLCRLSSSRSSHSPSISFSDPQGQRTPEVIEQFKHTHVSVFEAFFFAFLYLADFNSPCISFMANKNSRKAILSPLLEKRFKIIWRNRECY